MSNKFKKIISIMTSVTTVTMVSGITMLAPLAASAIVGTIQEGDTIKTADNPDVYIAKYVGTKQFKRLILNPDVFNSYGHLSWAKIKTVTQAEMDQFVTSDLVRADGDTKVYKLTPNGDVGTKQHLNMTAEQFVAAGYDWDSIYVINNVDRDNYTTGTDITSSVTPPPVTGALTVALASDTPAAGIAPTSAARVPFTKINLTAGSAGATVTALTVQRTGLSDDAAVSSVALIDAETNLQVGLNQTLNASHQVVFRESLTIPANTTKSYILAANMPSSLTSFAGQVAALSLVAVETTSSVSGVLPITGNGQTINATLVLGTVAPTTGSINVATSTKEVGTTGFNFSSIKLTAGSGEDLTVSSIRFNQSGSAAASDLANIVVSDGTTNYATTISSDGKYYTASFGSGLKIAKGANKEFTIKGDIVSGSNRTISFDIYRTTDIVVKGDLFGYFLTISANTTFPWNTSGNPVFNGNDITIGTGSLRVDKSSSGAPSGNLAEGVTGATLGAFDFVVAGEGVNVASIVLDVDRNGTGSTTDLTNVILTKEDGTVLAGPVNGADNSASDKDGTVTFSSTISFPVGTTKIIVKGNLNTDWVADDTIIVGFNTPATRITSATGATTGNSITATPASAIWGNTQTVKNGSMAVTVSGTPVTATVVRGINGFIFANYILDTATSGEDVKISNISLRQVVDAAANDSAVTSMQLFDGATPLNTGTNVVNPDGGSTTNTYTFTFDTPLVVTKGTQKTLALKGNISGSATSGGTQRWGIAASATISVTGVSTGQTVTVTTALQAGQTMTITGNGQYSVALDASNPAVKLIAANTTGNIMTVLRFKATAEQINVSKVRLGLTSASSTAIDLAQVYLREGSASGTILGQSTFAPGAGTLNAASSTFSLNTPLQVPSNTEKLVYITADIAPITTTETVATAGHVIKIDYYGSTNNTENAGTGQSSGATIAGYSPTTSTNGHFIYKSVPTVAAVALPTTALSSNNIAYTLSKFKVTADAKGDIDLAKFTFTFATANGSSGTLSVTTLTLWDVTEVSEVSLHASGAALNTNLSATYEFFINTNQTTSGTYGAGTTTRSVAAGTSRTFELRGTVSGIQTGASISTQLDGDAAEVSKAADTFGLFVGVPNVTVPASSVNNDTHNDFIWSDMSDVDHSASTSAPVNTSTTDWYNGYLVPGLPSSNLPIQSLSK